MIFTIICWVPQRAFSRMGRESMRVLELPAASADHHHTNLEFNEQIFSVLNASLIYRFTAKVKYFLSDLSTHLNRTFVFCCCCIFIPIYVMWTSNESSTPLADFIALYFFLPPSYCFSYVYASYTNNTYISVQLKQWKKWKRTCTQQSITIMMLLDEVKTRRRRSVGKKWRKRITVVQKKKFERTSCVCMATQPIAKWWK